MERTSGNAAVRLGPLALRLLARRRRWLRWAAIALAALTILSAAAQLHHRPPARRTGTAADRARVRTPAPRFHGVAGIVPPGMRAVNLIVPAAATFGGRLAPWSRVDVLAAFDVGQERAVRRVLTSGLVLHVTPQFAPAAAGTPSPLSPAGGRFGLAPVAEVTLAVPAAREREVMMAQAFGRMFVAVEPATIGGAQANETVRPHGRSATAPSPADDALSLRRYLGLPAAASPVAGAPPSLPTSGGLPPPPALPWPPGAMPRPGAPADVSRDSARRPDARRGGVTIEVIEDTTRTFVEVLP
jgi:Flp pilus assembly protein CpaB